MVDFQELNEKPATFHDQVIQVSGAYTPLIAPTCPNYSGPVIRWSLVGDNLQLNATGFENILRLAEPDLPMTVIGIWRLYQGPLGCGKAPPEGSVWYLDVNKIVEPNPLLGSILPAVTFVPGPGHPTPAVPELPTSEAATPTAEVMLTATPTPSGSPDPALTPSPTPVASPVTTVTPTSTPLGHTPLPSTETPVGTPVTGTPTVTPSPTIEGQPTATVAPGESPTPILPTSTPRPTGYPESTATATIDPYP